MSINRYGTLLTIILIILIVAIIAGLGILGYNLIKPKTDKNKSQEAIAEFDREFEISGTSQSTGEQEQEQQNENPTINPINPTENENIGTTKKKTKYKGFVMLGYIKIPKTGVEEPILDTVTPDSLNTAVATLYPSNPQLNKPGNVVIIGHNYKNGQFFSDNKKLSVGDKLTIKDNTGTQLTYTIYEKFETTPEDTSFYNRNTNGAIEVTLSTCTDDAKARIIILARVEQ